MLTVGSASNKSLKLNCKQKAPTISRKASPLSFAVAYVIQVEKSLNPEIVVYVCNAQNSRNLFVTDFVLAVYAVVNSKRIPVLPKVGVALAREQSQSGIRQSDVNYWQNLS